MAQWLQKALTAHQQSWLDEALAYYRKVLKHDAGHAVSQANLASIYTRKGQTPEALECYQKVLQGDKTTAETWFNYGNLQQRLGMDKDAAQSFQYALRLKPDLYPVHYNLGNLLRDQNEDEAALTHYLTAIELNPEFTPAHRNLGNLLRRMGRTSEAIEQHHITLAQEPQQAENHFNLANALVDANEQDEAILLYRQALRLAPNMGAALLNLGNLLRVTGDLAAAEDCYQQILAQADAPVAAYVNLVRLYQTQQRKDSAQIVLLLGLAHYPQDVDLLRLHGDALYQQDDAAAALEVYLQIEALQPWRADTCNALGVAHKALGQLAEAENDWHRCLAIDARHVTALTNLGTLCRLQKRHEAALTYLRKVIEIQPNDADSVASLASTLIELGSISEALNLIAPTLATQPHHADLLSMKANALTQQARIDEAQTIMAQVRQLKPDRQIAIGNSLFSSLYSDSLDATALTQLHRELAESISRNVTPYPDRRILHNGQRALRVAYLSPDFRTHPIGFFIEPVLQHHNTGQFDVTCYALPCAQDAHTERLKSYGHRWRDLEGWNLARMGAQIQEDGIDILIDLAGYTAGGQIDLMARHPAPIQVLFLGYPYTTGLKAMDYIIADRHLIPSKMEGLYTERVARLGESFLCYQPQPGTPEVAPLPALANGYITFGSFNNLPKSSASCIDLWVRVLQAVPNSRLALMASSLADAGTRELFRQHFIVHGIADDRIILLPPVTPLNRFLTEYGRIDIALDPIPYNGGTTSCEAMWMGVPVVTLAGEGFMSRMGVSLLNTVNHAEWIATDEASYVRIAKDMTTNIAALANIRSVLRGQMLTSGLCDAARYTASLEGLYLQMIEAHMTAFKLDESQETL